MDDDKSKKEDIPSKLIGIFTVLILWRQSAYVEHQQLIELITYGHALLLSIFLLDRHFPYTPAVTRV